MMQSVNLDLMEAEEVECCSRELPQMKLSHCHFYLILVLL
jgi:hypothetical protein